MNTTYGLGTNIRGPAGSGLGLMGQGMQQQQLGTQLLSQAADAETRRNAENKQRAAADKAGKVQLGTTAGVMAGAQWGSALGPWGMVIGGVLGAFAGSVL